MNRIHEASFMSNKFIHNVFADQNAPLHKKMSFYPRDVKSFLYAFLSGKTEKIAIVVRFYKIKKNFYN